MLRRGNECWAQHSLPRLSMLHPQRKPTDQGPDTTTKPQTTARQLETHMKFEVCLKGNIAKSLWTVVGHRFWVSRNPQYKIPFIISIIYIGRCSWVKKMNWKDWVTKIRAWLDAAPPPTVLTFLFLSLLRKKHWGEAKPRQPTQT